MSLRREIEFCENSKPDEDWFEDIDIELLDMELQSLSYDDFESTS